MAGQPGLFDLDERYGALSAAGDPLERLASAVDFELFRIELGAALDRSDRSRGGRPPYDPVLMFRVLVLQTLYTLSDDQTEYQLKDRLSFMRFCRLALEDRVPDAKTVWLFREQLTRTGAVDRLFARFDAVLRDAGYLAMGGQIVDATVVQARRPRLTRDERATLKGGNVPEGWSKAKRAQMDTDGRWTLRRGRKRSPDRGRPREPSRSELVIPVFGYKNHLGIDRHFGFMRSFAVTDAAKHDGGNSTTCSATIRPEVSGPIAPTARPPTSRCWRAAGSCPSSNGRSRPMPPHIARGNVSRARVRGVVEHVFATQKCRLGLVIRSIGLARTKASLGLANLITNMRRLAWFETRLVPA